MSDFNLPGRKGFHVKLANGYTVSVQQGTGTYSSGPNNAEIAAWAPNGDWVRLGDSDDVKGWCTLSDLMDIMDKVAAL